MSQLLQLFIGKEIARVKGIQEQGDQFRIGAIAAVMPNPMLGLVLANVIADREAPLPPRKPSLGEPGKPEPGKAEPPPTAGKGGELPAGGTLKSAR